MPYFHARHGLTTQALNCKLKANRCFFDVISEDFVSKSSFPLFSVPLGTPFGNILTDTLDVHLRVAPEREYIVANIPDKFPGQFNDYVVSIIANWTEDENQEHIQKLACNLEMLGLTSSIKAEWRNDAQIEIMVGQKKESINGTPKWINIADVGSGVSQVLPVLVALLVAKPGQMVYIEEQLKKNNN